MRASRRPRPSPEANSPTPEAAPDLNDQPADGNDPPIEAEIASKPARVSMQRHLSRPSLGAWKVNPTVVFVVIALAAAGSVSLINQRFGWPTAVLTWWPLAVVIFAAVWLIGALARQSKNGWLASVTLLGLAIGLLLTTAYSMNFASNWLGVGLITIGAGTLLRGLLWGTRV